MTNVRYQMNQGPDTQRGPSARLWQGYEPQSEQSQDGHYVASIFDDFFGLDTGTYTVTQADAGATLALSVTELYGALLFTTGATGNNEATLSGTGKWGEIDSDTGKLWFETRLKISNVTDSVASLGVGLGEAATGANFLTDSTGVVADIDFVGFNVVDADADALTTVYNTNGGGGVVTLDSTLARGALTADTWIKLGLWFDGSDIEFFINGQECATKVALTATNFPNGEALAPIIGVKTTTTTSFTLTVDWVAFAQEVI